MPKLTGAAKEAFLQRMQSGRKGGKRSKAPKFETPRLIRETHPETHDNFKYLKDLHGEREITAKELFFGAKLRRRR